MASLRELAGMLSEHVGLETTLRRVADLAVAAIPGACGSGLTLLERDRPQTVVWTAAFVHTVDDVQYGLLEGPCVSAVAAGRTFMSGNLGGEPQWPRFGPRAGRLGVHSALSLPLRVADRTLGALNVYGTDRDAFDAESVQLGEAFAAPAAVSVANAQTLAQAERAVAQLTTALTSRAEIDQAIGVLRSRSGMTAAAALSWLRDRSQASGVKLADVARALVTEAVGTARARRSGGPGPTGPLDESAT